jgi:hypothetical protein
MQCRRNRKLESAGLRVKRSGQGSMRIVSTAQREKSSADNQRECRPEGQRVSAESAREVRERIWRALGIRARKRRGALAERRATFDECVADIRSALAGGPMAVEELCRLCHGEGYPRGMVNRARRYLWVQATALEKDRGRRYETANSFAAGWLGRCGGSAQGAAAKAGAWTGRVVGQVGTRTRTWRLLTRNRTSHQLTHPVKDVDSPNEYTLTTIAARLNEQRHTTRRGPALLGELRSVSPCSVVPGAFPPRP